MIIIDGKKSVGALADVYYEKGSKEAELAESMRNLVQLSNTNEVMGSQEIAQFLLEREEVVPRIPGQPIALEFANVLFSPGGIASDAEGFDTYYSNFTLKKGMPLQVKAFSHSTEEILEARNNGVNLLAKDEADLEKITKAYINRYVPYVRLLPLITGSSLTAKCPTKATKDSDDEITRAFGWLRGEDVSDLMPSIHGITHANHFRARRGTALDKADITDTIDLLEKYDNYSGEGVIAIAHPRTIETLGMLYKAPTNQDKMVIDGVYAPNFLGCTWFGLSQMHKDFIIFLDAGNRKLLFKGVNKDEEQRGFKLIEENHCQGFKFDSGANGLKAMIFEEEFYVPHRWSGAILDINEQGEGEDGSDMKAQSITKLENFAKQIEKMYNRAGGEE